MGLAHSPSIVTNGLVLYLDAANRKSYPGSGTTWSDLSNQQLTGSMLNGPTFSSSNGGVLSFDGVDDNVTVTGVENPATTNQFTLSVWAKSNTSTWNSYGFLICRRVAYLVSPEFGTKDVNMYVIGNAGYQASGFTVPDITIWNEYAVTYNAGTITAYLNGVRMSSLTAGTAVNSETSTVFIGRDNINNSRYMNGSISNVKIYNQSLTEAQINQNFNALRGRFGV